MHTYHFRENFNILNILALPDTGLNIFQQAVHWEPLHIYGITLDHNVNSACY